MKAKHSVVIVAALITAAGGIVVALINSFNKETTINGTITINGSSEWSTNSNSNSSDGDNLKDIIVFESAADNANNNDSTESRPADLNTDTELINKVNVPNVVGMEQNDAISALYMSGLQFQVSWSAASVSDNDKYYVVDQSCKYGDSVNLGTIVKLELSPTLPESIDYKVFIYERNDSSVKDTSELNGFYLYSKSVTSASFYDSLTNEIQHPDYLLEKLCEVSLNITGADNAVLSIYIDGKSTGVCIDNKSGTADFFINKGKYIVNADFGDYTKTEHLYVDSSGNYTVNFK